MTDPPTTSVTAPVRRGRRLTPQARTWALSAAVGAPTLALLATRLGGAGPTYDAAPWLAALVFVGFIVSEPLVFHVEARNEAVSFSPSDIPLALGVLALSPMTLIAVRLVAAVIALRRWRRPPAFKLVLNLAAFTVESGVAIATFRALGAGLAPGPALWLALTASLVVGLVAGGITIAAAISFFEGSLGARVRREFTHSYLYYLPGAVLGASAGVPFLVEPWLLAVFVLPAPMVWLVLRSHGSLMHRYTDLTQIHAFSSQVGRSAHLQEIADTAVREIAGHLRARSVALVVGARTGETIQSSLGTTPLLSMVEADPETASCVAALETGIHRVRADRGDALGRAVWRAGAHETLVVVLGDDGDRLGVLELADRQGAAPRFDSHDIERLRPLSEQLTVALRKGQLHLEIQHKALHDRLTGLANRAYFDAWVSQHVDGVEDPRAGLLMIDLDRFKEVNDTLGHQAGDRLLREVTARLRAAVTERDLVARFGGDEFAVFVPDVGADEASLLAEVINEALEEPVRLGETTVAIGGSVGIALAPEHGGDVETLLRRADLAMYHAKRRHERSAVFDPALDETDSTRLALLADLRDALNTGAIEVHFQAQKDVHRQVICSAEALARWNHPVHGVVPPDVFVPLAEQTGLVGRLTEHVLHASLRAARRWADAGHEVGVAVNISAQSLVNDTFPEMIANALRVAGVPAERLTLEITERAMIGDSERVVDTLQQLHQLGVRLSVDDFGTGYSSMANLRHLPIAELKIDRSFVAEMLTRDNDEVLVSSTLALGHNLGMAVVAEGVEDVRTERSLHAAGCDIVQGYGISRPLPAAQFEAFLETAPTRRSRPLADATPRARGALTGTGSDR